MQTGNLAVKPEESHLLIHGLSNIFQFAREVAKPSKVKVNYISTGKIPLHDLEKTTAHRIIDAFVDKQSDEMLENPQFLLRVEAAYKRADAGTFGRCSCGQSLSANVIVNGDSLTELCFECQAKHAQARAQQCKVILQDIKDSAQSEIAELIQQSKKLALVEGDTRKSGDEADRTTDQSSMLLILTQINTREKQVTAINEAMLRIANGTFGICCACKQEIPIGRLKSVPFTKQCTTCKTTH